jgi:hypothetical protein
MTKRAASLFLAIVVAFVILLPRIIPIIADHAEVSGNYSGISDCHPD